MTGKQEILPVLKEGPFFNIEGGIDKHFLSVFENFDQWDKVGTALRGFKKSQTNKNEFLTLMNNWARIRVGELWDLYEKPTNNLVSENWSTIEDGNTVLSFDMYCKIYTNMCNTVVWILNGVSFDLTLSARNRENTS
jgi:hypothetical protein